ncbi:uncharacterized protein SPPG_06756 [Spizellomyces punctatus DAOM BR117]|uniref:C2H2-type domain-containing protein n=1 Tax=Spizellomyces punctatus (strain DAOM BR117) TaxID=645134 RepID=A0A0L0H8A9_SPIPD|nr:uncharacterized protein SPPG_06756 [Spizellomyces punctatus DAOM BR117]KNC97755.1 hypothetical protein SPPG_06756 [Spizellomyces punctatus DAOM BR117]|eukprot:XP_016605795.1 hypothetical protein SPPG_06756 [Spizellomyces punctatus DAOM BR117]
MALPGLSSSSSSLSSSSPPSSCKVDDRAQRHERNTQLDIASSSPKRARLHLDIKRLDSYMPSSSPRSSSSSPSPHVSLSPTAMDLPPPSSSSQEQQSMTAAATPTIAAAATPSSAGGNNGGAPLYPHRMLPPVLFHPSQPPLLPQPPSQQQQQQQQTSHSQPPEQHQQQEYHGSNLSDMYHHHHPSPHHSHNSPYHTSEPTSAHGGSPHLPFPPPLPYNTLPTPHQSPGSGYYPSFHGTSAHGPPPPQAQPPRLNYLLQNPSFRPSFQQPPSPQPPQHQQQEQHHHHAHRQHHHQPSYHSYSNNHNNAISSQPQSPAGSESSLASPGPGSALVGHGPRFPPTPPTQSPLSVQSPSVPLLSPGLYAHPSGGYVHIHGPPQQPTAEQQQQSSTMEHAPHMQSMHHHHHHQQHHHHQDWRPPSPNRIHPEERTHSPMMISEQDGRMPPPPPQHNYVQPYTDAISDMDKQQRMFKCPTPYCSKIYKNANGLKYHLERGSCEMEWASGDEYADLSMLNIKVAHRPYWCRVAGCGKKYKNLNGLKYHAKAAHPELDFGKEVKGHLRW